MPQNEIERDLETEIFKFLAQIGVIISAFLFLKKTKRNIR